MNEGAAEQLAEALGEGSLQRHEPVEIDGWKLGASLRPRDAEALAQALGACERLGLAAIVRGGGTALSTGNPPQRADLWLSTQELAGIDELDAGEGVCRARAGTPLRELASAAAAAGWELPLDPPGAAATLGGALAGAAVGPRSLGFGRPRDLVLGMELALASGERVHCGGRVVKNVTGYDLAKLYTGSFGTLGVIEAAWLRLRPRPERVALLESVLPDVESACQIGLAAARRPTARAAALSSRAEGGFTLCVELAGEAPSVDADAAGLAAEPAAPAALERVRDLQGLALGLRFRLALRPSRLPAALARLGAAGAELLAYPGLGLVWARFDASADSDIAAAWAAVETAAREAGGCFRLESGPLPAKQGRDVFGDATPGQPLLRSLKERFDPHGVLNPGRFAGGL